MPILLACPAQGNSLRLDVWPDPGHPPYLESS